MMRLYNPATGVDPSIRFGHYRDKKTDKMLFSHGVVYHGHFPVLLAQDGILVKVGYSSKKFGHYAIFKHSDNLYTLYAHGASVPQWKLGDLVEAGDLVFESGDSGNAKTKQLYFEVRTGILFGKRVDPYSYLTPGDWRPGVEIPEQQHLKNDGKMGKKTWKALQEALKSNRTFGFSETISGKDTVATWLALKESVGSAYDGDPNVLDKEAVIRGVQRKLMFHELYFGEETGVFDKETVASLQRALNASKYR
jgi:hypothetical protein